MEEVPRTEHIHIYIVTVWGSGGCETFGLHEHKLFDTVVTHYNITTHATFKAMHVQHTMYLLCSESS